MRRLRSLLSELGQVPALPHDLAFAGDDEETGWRLCDLAPLTSSTASGCSAAPASTSRWPSCAS